MAIFNGNLNPYLLENGNRSVTNSRLLHAVLSGIIWYKSGSPVLRRLCRLAFAEPMESKIRMKA